MNKEQLIAALMVGTFLFAGCASIVYRVGIPTDKGRYAFLGVTPGIYPGVRADTNVLKDITTGKSEALPRAIMFLPTFIDIFLSFTLDTITLPYDIFQIGRYVPEKETPFPTAETKEESQKEDFSEDIKE